MNLFSDAVTTDIYITIEKYFGKQIQMYEFLY